MATEFLLPDIGDGLTEAEVVRWLVEEGAEVGRDDPLVEVETDKAVVVIPSPVEGTVLRHGASPGETMAVGAVLAVIGSRDEAHLPTSGPAASRDGSARPGEGGPRKSPSGDARAGVQALPVVRRLARQKGVDLGTVQGSGPGGRITRSDVLAAARSSGVPAGGTTDGAHPASGEAERRPLTRLQRTIAANMTRSWSEIPHVTTFDQVDVTRLVAARKSLSESHGVDVSFDALAIGAVIPALRRHPEFNATLEDDHLLLHSGYHIGVAINAPDGLLVGVLRDVGEMSVLQIAEGTRRLADRGRSRSLGGGGAHRADLYSHQHRRAGRRIRHSHHPSRKHRHPGCGEDRRGPGGRGGEGGGETDDAALALLRSPRDRRGSEPPLHGGGDRESL